MLSMIKLGGGIRDLLYSDASGTIGSVIYRVIELATIGVAKRIHSKINCYQRMYIHCDSMLVVENNRNDWECGST